MRHLSRALGAAAALAALLTPSSGEAQTYPTELLQNLRWENIGPARGGRSTAVAGSISMPEP